MALEDFMIRTQYAIPNKPETIIGYTLLGILLGGYIGGIISEIISYPNGDREQSLRKLANEYDCSVRDDFQVACQSSAGADAFKLAAKIYDKEQSYSLSGYHVIVISIVIGGIAGFATGIARATAYNRVHNNPNALFNNYNVTPHEEINHALVPKSRGG